MRRMIVVMRMVVRMILVVVMAQPRRLIRIPIGVVNMSLVAVIMVVRLVIMRGLIMRLFGLDVIRACTLDHAALDPFALAATARVAVAWTAAIGPIFGFFLSLAMSALV